MARYWRLLAEYDAETTSYSAAAGAAQTSPFSPPEKARLVGLRSVINRSAASSLINHIQWKVSCTSFTPNEIHAGGQGSGLQTAPALQSGITATNDWDINQAVEPGVPITVEARNVTADTPVTVSALLYGLFDNGK